MVQKRSPSPIPAGGEVIEAHDYLGLVKKAANAAVKVTSRASSSQDDRLNDKALKWLQRAQASIYRDANLINKIQTHYSNKMLKSVTGEYFLRQRHKRVLWDDHARSPRDPSLEALIDEMQSRYLQDWSYHKALGFEQQRLLGPGGVSQETFDNLNDAFRAWSLCRDATAIEAMRMAKKELLYYGQISDDPTQHQMRKIDLATKAIAWAIKYRILQEQNAARGMKRPRDGDGEV